MKKILIVCVLILFVGILTAFTADRMPCPEWVKDNPWPPEDIMFIVGIPGIGNFSVNIPKHDFRAENYDYDWRTMKDHKADLEKRKANKLIK